MYSSSLFYFNLFAALLQLTVAAFLFFRKNNTAANKLLSLIFLCPVITISANVVFILFRNHNLFFLNSINVGVGLCFGPALLTYIHLLQGKKQEINFSYLLHFLLSLVTTVSSSAYYFIITEEKRKFHLDLLLKGEDFYTNTMNTLLLCHMMVYLIIAHFKIKKYSLLAANFYSHLNKIEIQWARSLVNYIVLLNVLLLFAYILPILYTGKSTIYSDLVATPFMSLLLYGFIVYKGFSSHAIFDKNTYLELIKETKPLNDFIVQTQLEQNTQTPLLVLDKKLVNETREKIERLFSEDRIHTLPKLKLHTMAEMLNISPGVLSKIINTSYEKSFFDLINYHRVENAKQLLLNPDCHHLKIESIGEMAGFSSRASFFSVFKKYMKITPSQYKQKLEKEAKQVQSY